MLIDDQDDLNQYIISPRSRYSKGCHIRTVSTASRKNFLFFLMVNGPGIGLAGVSVVNQSVELYLVSNCIK